MTSFLSEDVRKGLALARRRDLKRKNRLRVRDGTEVFPILRFRDSDFTLERENSPRLRGLVDIMDGSRHLYQALIVTAAEEGDEMIYEFKRVTPALDAAPVDYAKDPEAPSALLSKS